MKKSLVPSIASALLVAACSSASPDPATSSASEALCGGGRISGCGPCVADPSSPLGGIRTCNLCGGDTYTQNCVPPGPTFDATWSGHVWIWTADGPTNGNFSIPVVFEEESGTWRMNVYSLSIPLGVTISLQSGKVGSGVVNGDDATLTLPLEAASHNVTVTLSTDATLSPSGVAPIHVGAYSPSLFQMVGEGTFEGKPFDVFLSGTITAWPYP